MKRGRKKKLVSAVLFAFMIHIHQPHAFQPVINPDDPTQLDRLLVSSKERGFTFFFFFLVSVVLEGGRAEGFGLFEGFGPKGQEPLFASSFVPHRLNVHTVFSVSV